MPVGLALGGAAIAGVATVASGAMGASAQRHAANQAADTSLQTAQMNNDLFREVRAGNEARLDPYSNNGLLASNALSDLLLGTHSFNPSAGASSGNGALSGYAPPSEEWANGALQAMGLGSRGNSPATLEAHLAGRLEGQLPASVRQAYDHYVQTHPREAAPTPAPSTGGGQTGALSAWDQFRQGTNYQWRLNQGANVLNSKNAANGAFESGAADKAAIQYGQNFASNELSNYMNLLAGQQAMGLSAAGAVAGVGNTYAGNVAAQNTNAGNAAANAQLVAGQGAANMWGAIGQGAGQLGGALFQYGMGAQQPRANYASPGSMGAINVNPNGLTNAGINWAGGW